MFEYKALFAQKKINGHKSDSFTASTQPCPQKRYCGDNLKMSQTSSTKTFSVCCLQHL